MEFLQSDIDDFASYNSSQPSTQIDLRFSQDIAFDRDVDDLFHMVYSDPSKTTTTTTSQSPYQYEYQYHPTEVPQYDFASPYGEHSTSTSTSTSTSPSETPTLKYECDTTPPLYSVLTTPETKMSFPDPEGSSTRKRKIEFDEMENETPVQKEKIIKRRERNRESAAASRQRKRDHITILENQVRELKNEKVSINREISYLEGQNQAMRDEIGHITNLVNTSPLLSSMWNRYNQVPSPVPQQAPKFSAAIKAAYFLFLVLFCAFNSSSPMEAQTKIAQPLLTTYFNFLATDGNHLQQEQLQGLMDVWLSDPLRLQSSSEDDQNLFGLEELSHSLGDLPDLSGLLSETQGFLLNGPGASDCFDTISALNPSLYQAVVQVANSAGSVSSF